MTQLQPEVCGGQQASPGPPVKQAQTEFEDSSWLGRRARGTPGEHSAPVAEDTGDTCRDALGRQLLGKRSTLRALELVALGRRVAPSGLGSSLKTMKPQSGPKWTRWAENPRRTRHSQWQG